MNVTVRANLQGTNRRHPGSPSATCAVGVGRRVLVGRIVYSPVLPQAPSTTCAEAIGKLGDRDHGHLAVVYRFTIDVTDAQTALEQLGDWLKWGRARHETSDWHGFGPV